MSKGKRRGKRVVVGYVVSHSGKRGGPWEAQDGPYGASTPHLRLAHALQGIQAAEYCAQMARESGHHPNAKALPLVRYELDAEEERLRDAVVASADAWEAAEGDTCVIELLYLAVNVRALRAHREKVGK